MSQAEEKIAEYMQLKKTLKTLRRDLREIKQQHEDYDELKKLNKKVKEIRDKIKSDDEIKTLKEKISSEKERFDLLKELIRIDLIENSKEKVSKDGRSLKLVYVLKDVKEGDK